MENHGMLRFKDTGLIVFIPFWTRITRRYKKKKWSLLNASGKHSRWVVTNAKTKNKPKTII